MQSETIVKREIGFMAKEASEKTVKIAVPSASPEILHESTPTERLITKLLNTVAAFTLLLVPIYLAVTFTAWWLLVWLFFVLLRKMHAGRD